LQFDRSARRGLNYVKLLSVKRVNHGSIRWHRPVLPHPVNGARGGRFDHPWQPMENGDPFG